MLINKNTFREFTLLEKIKSIFKTLPPGSAFYVYISLYIILILLFLTLNTFIKNNFTAETFKYKETLNIYSLDTVKNISPALGNNKTEMILSRLLFAGLLRYENGNYIYDIAENINGSSDGLSLTINIKPDAKFSNGENITSDDVIFSYKLMQDYNIDNKDRAKYEGLEFEKIDDKTFKINLKKSYSEIQNLFTLGIVSKSYYNKYESQNISDIMLNKNNDMIVTSGQYKIETLNIGQNSIDFLSLKNNDYYANLSHIIKINFFLDKIESGYEEKYFDNNNIEISLSDIPNLNSSKYIKDFYTSSRIKTIFFNPNKNEIWAKKENRKFLYSIIDRYHLSNDVLGGLGSSTYDILPTSRIDNNTDNIIDTDISKTTLLKSSSTSFSMVYLADNEIDKKVFEYLKETLANYKIDLIGKAVSQEEMQSIIKNRDYELLLSAITLEDFTSLYSFFHSSQKNAPGLNLTNYVSKDFDQNVELLRRSTDTNEKMKALGDLRKEFYEEFPYIPLYARNYFIITDKNIKLNLDSYISNESRLLENIRNSYKQKEYVYKFLQNHIPFIAKVSRLIN